MARARAPWALVHEGDFFSWAAKTKERFECAAGNPPFIRYQRFTGDVRHKAIELCASVGAQFSGLSSSWAPFIVAAASLLKPGGRIAFVVPAEIGHAPYAEPLLGYLTENFSDLRLLAVRSKIFNELSEDVWLLYAEGFGGRTSEILLSEIDRFTFLPDPPQRGTRVTTKEWIEWNCRLRPFLMNASTRNLYKQIVGSTSTFRLGDVAQVGIGYVTGANDFFHLRPSEVRKIGVPKSLLQPTVRNGRMFSGTAITRKTVRDWLQNDEPVLLLKLSAGADLPRTVRSYLNSSEGKDARSSYKCSNRSPWYVVPDVVIPDGFLSYMSGSGPAFVANSARCAGTNSVHTVRIAGDISFKKLQSLWDHPFTRLSCEVEGHPLGGGMLKVEPREAQRIALANRAQWGAEDIKTIEEGVQALRAWRHYSAKQ